MSVVELARKDERKKIALKIAKSLLTKGYDFEDVVECTELSVEEVKALQDELVVSNYLQEP